MRAAASAEKRGGLSRQLRLIALILALLAVFSILGNRGLIRLYHLRQDKAALAQEIDRLGAANAVLADEVRAMRTDPSRLEAIAREDLGLVKPGELVFAFPPAPTPRQP